jgi:hypothetical protein
MSFVHTSQPIASADTAEDAAESIVLQFRTNLELVVVISTSCFQDHKYTKGAIIFSAAGSSVSFFKHNPPMTFE